MQTSITQANNNDNDLALQCYLCLLAASKDRSYTILAHVPEINKHVRLIHPFSRGRYVHAWNTVQILSL